MADLDGDLVDYEEEPVVAETAVPASGGAAPAASTPMGHVGIHTSSFRDFLLKPELLQALADCGFEHPSEVQQQCVPQALLGSDIICQAKSGMGKTAVFVLATLNQLDIGTIIPDAKGKSPVQTLVLVHTRELAFQICQEYERFTKFLPAIKVAVVFGGIPLADHIRLLGQDQPHVLVGTPGRILQLVKKKKLNLTQLKNFVMDEYDKLIGDLDMRRDVQQIFKHTPAAKQVMMFSATAPKEVKETSRKFTQFPIEVFVDDEKNLTLHGLQQYHVTIEETAKNRKLADLLDNQEFNQVIIYVNSVRRCKELNRLLVECNFPSICIHKGLRQNQRVDVFHKFRSFQARILVATDIFGRGVDFERVNIVVNYDMPGDDDSYLHRVGRSGRFGTKGLAISFISSDEDRAVLAKVQSRFAVGFSELPSEPIDASTYLSS